jgi:transposase
MVSLTSSTGTWRTGVRRHGGRLRLDRGGIGEIEPADGEGTEQDVEDTVAGRRPFDKLYVDEGRPSIPLERLLRASLVQLFYSIRSERQLMERLGFDLPFRWFVGLGIDDPVPDVAVFTKNRDRLRNLEIAQGYLVALLAVPRAKQFLSREHFTVDGTLLNARASMKSFRPKNGGANPPDNGRNGARDFRGERRSNETHADTTDPDARLSRKGNGLESVLRYMGHALTENRNGLAVAGTATHATGAAERQAARAGSRSVATTGMTLPASSRRCAT